MGTYSGDGTSSGLFVPVRLDDSEVPVALSNIDYVAARFSVIVAGELAEKFGMTDVRKEMADEFFNILSIAFEISEKTAVEVFNLKIA